MRELYEKRERLDLKKIFDLSSDAAEFLRVMRESAQLYTTRYLPDVMDTLVAKAKEGNMAAIRLFCEIHGLTGARGSQQNVAIQNVVKISPEELKTLELDLRNG